MYHVCELYWIFYKYVKYVSTEKKNIAYNLTVKTFFFNLYYSQ